jgi:hypothetical protein
MSVVQGPKLIELSWEGVERPNGNEVAHINDYDIVVNEQEAGYRNNGVYIFKDGKICDLGYVPDDYGCLPEWVKLSKHDFGYSYFSECMIDHNCYVPFKPLEWIMGESYIETPSTLNFQFYYKEVPIITDFYRKKDGATIKLTINVMFSLTDIGGPADHMTEGGGGGNGSENYSYYYVNGEKITLRYTSGWKDGSYAPTLPNDITCPEVVILESEINDAITMLRKLLSSLKNIIYLDCTGPCEVSLDTFPVKDSSDWKTIVFPIKRN